MGLFLIQRAITSLITSLDLGAYLYLCHLHIYVNFTCLLIEQQSMCKEVLQNQNHSIIKSVNMGLKPLLKLLRAPASPFAGKKKDIFAFPLNFCIKLEGVQLPQSNLLQLLGDRKFAYTFLLLGVSKRRHKFHFCRKHIYLHVKMIYVVKPSVCLHLLKQNEQLLMKQLLRKRDKYSGVSRCRSGLLHSINGTLQSRF